MDEFHAKRFMNQTTTMLDILNWFIAVFVMSAKNTKERFLLKN